MQYGAEISYADHHIGRLIEDLDARGLLDDAVVVVSTDHGESLWEHSEPFNHGFTVYQSVMRSLCLIRLPEAAARACRIDGVVANIDVLPTALDILGIECPEGLDGEALPLYPSQARNEARTRFGEATKPWSEPRRDGTWYNASNARCVRRGPHKFVRVPYEGKRELYNVLEDPDEWHNLLEEPSPRIAALAADLASELAAWSASADPFPSGFDPSQREETVERLRSLGYLD